MNQIPTLIEEIISKRKANAHIPQNIVKNLQSLQSKVNQFKDLQQVITTSSTDAVSQNISQFNFKTLNDRIVEEQEIWQRLYQRLNRDTINIGVIGRARQGKSTLLQKLTGLTDSEIPTSSGLPCTSVQSNIYHLNKDTYAKVYFYSESAFLKQVIHPYYEELGFSNLPQSLYEFCGDSLPAEPTNPRHPAKAKAIYKRLRDDYHTHFNKYGAWIGKDPQTVKKELIKEYVSQDYDEKSQPRSFNHLAVEKVEIFCSFPKTKVEKIGLVDMPGLGDIRLGDTERMIKALAQDIDFILFVRRPSNDKTGDLWGRDTDISLYDYASQALQARLPLSEWSFMLLNYDGENGVGCKNLENTMINTGIRVKKSLRHNCASSEDSNIVLTEVLDELGENMTRLDQQYMSASFRELANFQSFVRTQIQGLQYTVESLGDIDGQYINLREEFLDKLYKEIEGFRAKLRQEPVKVNAEFSQKVTDVIEQCKTEVKEPNQQDIETLAYRDGIDQAYFDAIHTMRASFLKQFHAIEGEMKESFEQTKIDLSMIFIRNGFGQLEYLAGKQGVNFFSTLAKSIMPMNSLKSLGIGFDFITSFEVTYKGNMQLEVWSKLRNILPPNPMTPNNLESEKTVLVTLQKCRQDAIAECTKGLNERGQSIYQSIHNINISMVEEFADHITRSANIKQEWDIFLIKNRCQIWPQLQKLEQQKQLQQQWLTLINEALALTQKLS
jgi:hypothetical protein